MRLTQDTRIYFFIYVPSLVLLGLPLQMQLSAQSITGRVTAGNSGLAVRGAGLILVDSTGSPKMAAISDSSGVFVMSVRQLGNYQLRAAGPTGLYQTTTPFFMVGLDQTVVNVTLATSTRLDTVKVFGKQDIHRSKANPHKFDEFLRRQSLGIGHFMTSAEIASKNARLTRDLVAGIPGMMVRESNEGRVIQSTRCSGGNIPGLDAGALAGGSAGPDKKLKPMLFVDGVHMSNIDIIDDISPGEIEAMEIFQGAAEVPAEAKGDSCTAIFIWLK